MQKDDNYIKPLIKYFSPCLKYRVSYIRTRHRLSKTAMIALLLCIFQLASIGQSKIDSILSCIRTAKDDTGKVKCLNSLSKLMGQTGSYDKAKTYADNAIALSKKINFKKGEIAAYSIIGIVSWYQGNYPEALKNDLIALKFAEEIGFQNGIANSYGNIGLVYYDQGNYPDALKNYIAALKIDEKIGDKNGAANLYTNIGLIYYEQGRYADALKNHAASLKVYEKIGDRQGIAKSYNNIGVVYDKQGNYSEALKNYAASLQVCREIGDKNGIATAYINLGEMNNKPGKYLEAKKYLSDALILSREIGNKSDIKECYNGLAKLDSAESNWKAAYEHHKLFMLYRDSLLNEANIANTIHAQMNYEFDKKEIKAKAAQEKKDLMTLAENRRTKIITGAISIILAMLMTLIMLLWQQQRVKSKKDKIIFENKQMLSQKQNALLKLEKQQVEEELENSKKLLNSYTENMLEKSELLEQFKFEIKRLKALKPKELYEEKMEYLDSLSKIRILTEDDWKKFQELFEKVYKGFFIRLKEKLPDLTPAEIRFVCLTKLKLKPKQMADILGISPETVRTTRYRLSKKLNLPEQENIETITATI